MCGIYGFQRYLLGEVNLAYAYYDMPDVIKDMSSHWLEFYSSICKKIITDARVDFVLFFEDMAYKNGPLIGPKLFKEFMTPYYKEMINIFKGMGVHNFMIDCDGNVDMLLDLFNEIGINMMDPFEQAAGNDIIKIRDRYPELVIWGGIDKRVLNMTKEDIKREVYSKVPYMWEKGGFIPSIDHSTQPCPMENFSYYLELLDDIWTKL
jgi:uroporphyrinogen decarboxylase